MVNNHNSRPSETFGLYFVTVLLAPLLQMAWEQLVLSLLLPRRWSSQGTAVNRIGLGFPKCASITLKEQTIRKGGRVRLLRLSPTGRNRRGCWREDDSGSLKIAVHNHLGSKHRAEITVLPRMCCGRKNACMSLYSPACLTWVIRQKIYTALASAQTIIWQSQLWTSILCPITALLSASCRMPVEMREWLGDRKPKGNAACEGNANDL